MSTADSDKLQPVVEQFIAATRFDTHNGCPGREPHYAVSVYNLRTFLSQYTLCEKVQIKEATR